MAAYQCGLCSYVYDEEAEGTAWADLPEDWLCPVCGSPRSAFSPVKGSPAEVRQPAPSAGAGEYLGQWRRPSDENEVYMADIHRMAETGTSIIEPMRTTTPTIGWEQILIKGAQLARIPLNDDVPVKTTTVIGPKAKHPLVIEVPVYVTHMSFGALSREAKLALSAGSAAVKTAMCSGEGGILPESLERSHRYIFEYVPNKYSVSDEYLARADAVEIKIGQSAKPGMGGHLPGGKVTPEIAAIRGRPEGEDIISPAHFEDILNGDDLRRTVDRLRDTSGGKPIGVKIAAGHIEEDLAVVLEAGPDFVTIDGRAGATGAAPKFVKGAASVPTVFALCRARTFLDAQGATGVSLVITGGLRISSDFAKALAMGADAIALGTAAMMAIGCQQYRICGTGKCPVGITSQDPELRARLDVDISARRVANYLRVCGKELEEFARLTGNDDVHGLGLSDICTVSSEISNNTAIQHV
jgi:glutamate synthase domain-containing protein 2/rubredoxin